MSNSAPDDFIDFAESVIKQKTEDAAWQNSYDQHKIWQESTFAGKATTWLKGLGKSGFIRAISKSIKEAQQLPGEKGMSYILLANLSRLMFIFVFILVVKVIGRIVQNMMGKEITKVEEVVIVHTVKSKEGDDGDGAVAASNSEVFVPTSVTRRGKKSKNA